MFYFLFPTVGPGHFDWANQMPMPHAPENCMPSMHLTWAFLIAMNLRSKPLRIVLWVYAVLIAVATLAPREHYLIDLIAALPYTRRFNGCLPGKTSRVELESRLPLPSVFAHDFSRRQNALPPRSSHPD